MNVSWKCIGEKMAFLSKWQVFNRQCEQKYISLMCNLFEKLIIDASEARANWEDPEVNLLRQSKNITSLYYGLINFIYGMLVFESHLISSPGFQNLLYHYRILFTYYSQGFDRPSKLLWK
jgi:hypothetical protein